MKKSCIDRQFIVIGIRDHSTCAMRSIGKGRIDEILRIFDRG